ncbi:MAG: formate dehydrogenase accessory sulfurtransferase FdhD [Desulfosarcinaceae bacterium]|nr:formate dehydrogenase accessory sulfurtransferase FdhD [Desulfosarcinaceae bacterium]
MHHTSTFRHWHPNGNEAAELHVIGEEPLAIRVQGNPYAVIMRTPGMEIEHATGFCLAEGLIDTRDDIQTIALCDGADTNTVTITLKPNRLGLVGPNLDRRGYISQSSCGICGKELVEDLVSQITPVTTDLHLPTKRCYDHLEQLVDHQPLRWKTKAAHAAAIYDAHFQRLSVAEDVGRHNALDKAVGQLVQQDRLQAAALLTLSSRVSYEMVQKTARAKIPVILAVSRPTQMAISLAQPLGLTIACFDRRDGLFIFTHPQRLV